MLHRHCKGYSDNKCLSINKFFTGLYRLVCSLPNFTSILFYNFLFSPEVLFLLVLLGDKFFLWLFSFELYFLSTFYYWIEFWRDAMNVQGNTRLYEHAYTYFIYLVPVHHSFTCIYFMHVSFPHFKYWLSLCFSKYGYISYRNCENFVNAWILWGFDFVYVFKCDYMLNVKILKRNIRF